MVQEVKLDSLLELLHRASQRADHLFAANMGDRALTRGQFAVLSAVSDQDGLSQTDIMVATGIDRSSTAELVRRLVTNGWLRRRRRKGDARTYSVRLTHSGRQMLAIGAPAAKAADKTLFELIPQTDQTLVTNALKFMASSPA
jgi:MarR family transcriptional regulator, temperature-dependent positive regulator of motility